MKIALFALIYASLRLFGFEFDFKPDRIAAFWPATGFYLAVLVLIPRSNWPRYVGAAFVSTLALDTLVGGFEFGTAVASAVAGTVEAVAGAVLLALWGKNPRRLDDPRELFLRVVPALVLATLAGACSGTLGFILVHPDWSWFAILPLWWAADFVGVLAVFPVVLAIAEASEHSRIALSRRQATELGGLLAMLGLLVAHATYVGASGDPALFGFPYAVFVFVIWASLRFEPSISGSVVLLLVTIAVVMTALGAGPFAIPDFSVPERAIYVQSFVCTLVVTHVGLMLESQSRVRLIKELAARERRVKRFINENLAGIVHLRFTPAIDLAAPPEDQVAQFFDGARVVHMNSAALRMFSAPDIAAVNSNAGVLVLPRTERNVEHVRRIVASVFKPPPLAAHGERVDGNAVELFASWIGEVERGHCAGAWAMLVDRTPLEHAEREAKRTRLRYEHMFESLPLAAWVEDWSEAKHVLDATPGAAEQINAGAFESVADVLSEAHGSARLLKANPAMAELFRYEDVDALARAFAARESRAADEEFAEILRNLFRQQYRFSIERSRTRASGEAFELRISVAVPAGHRDDWSRVILLGEDVTSRVQAQRAVAESEATLRAFFEYFPEILVMKDPAGRVIYANVGAAQRHGKSASELTGSVLSELLPPEQAVVIERAEEAALRTGRPVRFDMHQSTAGTAGMDLDLVKFPLWDDRGSLLGTGTVATEVTAQLDEQRELERQRDRLRQLTSEISFEAERERRRIARDIEENPRREVNAANRQLREAARKCADLPRRRAIDAAASSLEELGETLGTFAFELSPPVLYDEGLTAALQWLAERTGTAHGLPTTVHVQGDVRPLDETTRILAFQSARELVVNAVKHAHASQLDVSVRFDDLAVAVDVVDDGRGLNEAAVARSGAGGFGLFNVRDRIDLAGGALTLESLAGSGTRARIVLPMESGHAA